MRIYLCLDVSKIGDGRGSAREVIMQAIEEEIDANVSAVEVDPSNGTLYDVTVAGMGTSVDDLAQSVRRRRENLRGLQS